MLLLYFMYICDFENFLFIYMTLVVSMILHGIFIQKIKAIAIFAFCFFWKRKTIKIFVYCIFLMLWHFSLRINFLFSYFFCDFKKCVLVYWTDFFFVFDIVEGFIETTGQSCIHILLLCLTRQFVYLYWLIIFLFLLILCVDLY